MFETPVATFRGMQISVSSNALEETRVRLFPKSKNRSKRVHKKLVKRFGGEFECVPTIFKMGNMIVMHPVRYLEFKERLKDLATQETDNG